MRIHIPSRSSYLRFSWLPVVILLAAGPAGAMAPQDILTMQRITPSGLDPEGRYLLYQTEVYDNETGQWRRTLLRRDLQKEKDLVIFTPEDRAHGVAWRPDGKAIAYLRSGQKGTKVWQMDFDGGNRLCLWDEPVDASGLQWSPDGTALAWIGNAAAENYEGLPGQIVVANGIDYRHLGAGYREGSLGRLLVLELDGPSLIQVFAGEWDVRSISWSPDSGRLVYEAKARVDMGWNLNSDLFIVERSGGEPVRLTTNPGADRNPTWLPDGRIAWLRATDPIWETAPAAIAVTAPDDGGEGSLQLHGTDFDNWIYKYTWSDSGFFVLGANRGYLDLVRVDGDSHEFITDGVHDFWNVQIAGGKAILSGAGQTLPGAVFQVDLTEKIKGPRPPRLLIDPNLKWRHRVGLTEPESFSIKVDGRNIEGWVFLPFGLEPGSRVPTVLSIHGGPEWMYGGYFLPEFHILPSFGYAVVIANPTGSTGYGFDFQRGIQGDWVDRPSTEVLACLDWAVAQGWADPDRLAVMGGSYGGLLAAELTTSTNRFRAAAVDRMYPETITFWGTTDEKWFPEWEFKGKPWQPEAREIYLRNSPFERVEKVRTPTLISQGLLDYRCLAAGGEIWFSALKSLGVPSRLLRFADEGHGIHDPGNQVFYYEQLLAWFEQHVLADEEMMDDRGDQ